MRPARCVVADAGPIHYLILIGSIDLLPGFFDSVVVPQAVSDELVHPEAPELVRAWLAKPPEWLTVQPNADLTLREFVGQALDAGERTVIALAQEIKADLVLMDDREGVAAARRAGLAVTGTLGFLDLAARRGMIDLADAFERLKATNFYYRQGLLDALLARRQQGDC